MFSLFLSLAGFPITLPSSISFRKPSCLKMFLVPDDIQDGSGYIYSLQYRVRPHVLDTAAGHILH